MALNGLGTCALPVINSHVAHAQCYTIKNERLGEQF